MMILGDDKRNVIYDFEKMSVYPVEVKGEHVVIVVLVDHKTKREYRLVFTLGEAVSFRDGLHTAITHHEFFKMVRAMNPDMEPGS